MNMGVGVYGNNHFDVMPARCLHLKDWKVLLPFMTRSNHSTNHITTPQPSAQYRIPRLRKRPISAATHEAVNLLLVGGWTWTLPSKHFQTSPAFSGTCHKIFTFSAASRPLLWGCCRLVSLSQGSRHGRNMVNALLRRVWKPTPSY